ncbi:MAG: hypothetical protein IID63_00950 [candidate division Zixibacteria bacterium]|nr:hypothetical protein [candidate division Zixibacteria bacterium]
MLSTIAMILSAIVGLSLIYLLIRTIQGHPVERRIVFVYIGLAVVLPLLMNKTLPLPITKDVIKFYDQLEKLQPGSKVLCAFDYDPPSAPELQPMAVAFLKYAFKKDLKIIIMGLWPQGPQQAQQAIEEAMLDPIIAGKNLVQGEDWVNLGFQSGNEFVIQSMGTEFKRMFPKDNRHIAYGDIPLLQDVVNFSNVDFVINFSAGKPGTTEWVQFGVDRFGFEMVAGNTAVQAPMMYPYLRTGQLKGLLGGMIGAAEFEKILDEKGKASTFLLAQTFAHATVIIFIIIGNLAFFSSRKKKMAGTQ